MPIVKALIGGLVGGCLGAYVASLFGPVRGPMGPWLILLAGIGAGLGARLLCGANRSFATGIVSAITAITGVALFSYMSAAVALRSSDEMEAPLDVARSVEQSMGEIAVEDQIIVDGESETATENEATSEAKETEAEPVADADDSASELPLEQERPLEPRNDAPDIELMKKVAESGNVQQAQSSSMDLIANAVSALLAFVIGTGSATAPKREPEES